MKILIFGGNRFVGKLITKKLALDGHDVTILNRSGTSPISCNVIKCDRNNKNDLEKNIGVNKYDCVIDMCLYNLEQAVNTVDILKSNVDKYIFVSSTAVYQEPFNFPLKETHKIGGGKIFGNYGINKSLIEKYFSDLRNFPYIIVRPTYILGEDNHLNREKYFFDKIINDESVELELDGNALLSFIFADDVANIILKLATTNSKTKKVYNLSNDEHLSINKFVELISLTVGKKLKIKYVNESFHFKNTNHIISNKSIKKVIGNYQFQTLKDGLKKIYESKY